MFTHKHETKLDYNTIENGYNKGGRNPQLQVEYTSAMTDVKAQLLPYTLTIRARPCPNSSTRKLSQSLER